MSYETTTTTTEEIEYLPEVTLESTSSLFDYLDLGLKALLVIAAFAIAARI